MPEEQPSGNPLKVVVDCSHAYGRYPVDRLGRRADGAWMMELGAFAYEFASFCMRCGEPKPK